MEIQLGKRRYTLRDEIGRVLRAEKMAITRTVSTLAHSTPDGGSRPASSHTSTHVSEGIQLELADGTPQTLKGRDTGLMVREGDVLHTIWMQPEGKGPDKERLVAMYNRTTGQEVWPKGNVEGFFFLTSPMWMGLVLSFIGGFVAMVIVSSLLGPLGMLAMVLPFLMPYLTWRADRNGRAQIAELKRIGHQILVSRRGDPFA